MTRRDALIGLLAIRPTLAQGADLKAAAVEAPITPAWSTTLWGYDNTTHYTRGVLDDIFAKTILFDAGKRFLLITLDVGAIGFDLTRRIARRIHEEIGLAEDAVAIQVTHNHSAPSMLEIPSVAADRRFQILVEDKLVLMARQAARSLAPATLHFGQVESFIGLNRRVGNRANTWTKESGPIDPKLSVLLVRSPAGSNVAVIVNYPSHPVTLREDNDKISADFPGVLYRELNRTLHCPIMYLQACCGDVIPKIFGGEKEMQEYGRKLADEAQRAITVAAPLANPAVNVRSQRVLFTFVAPIPLDEFRATYSQHFRRASHYQRQWAARYLRYLEDGGDLRQSRDSIVQVASLGDLSFAFLPGEILHETSLLIRREFPQRKLIVAGYTNDTSVGYLPHADEFPKGRYEVEDAWKYYGTLRTTPQMEKDVREAAIGLLRGILIVLAVLMLSGKGEAQMRRRVFSRILDQDHVGDMAYVPECYLPQITNGPNFPTWSPDGKQLAFAMKGSIWRLRLGETTAYELTAGASYDSQPAWSPDGRWIAYTAEQDERIHLKLLDVSSGAVSDLTHGDSVNVEPAWAPDGKRLAYVSTALGGVFKIFLVPMNGGAPGPPVLLTPDFRLDPPSVYYGDMAHYINPAWMPDGRDLIFVSNRDNRNGSGGLYRMKAEPGSPMQRFHYEETTWKVHPNVSSDGARLVFSSYLGRQWQQLWTIPPSGGDAFPLTYGDFDRTTPKWSPDGSRVAFISNQTGDKTLWLFHWFGGKLERVSIERLVYRRPMGKLTVRIVDAADGKPVAARVHLDASDGRTYAPSESWLRADFFVEDHLETTPYQFFYTSGTFDVMLPLGRTILTVTRGLEYQPSRLEAEIKREGAAALTVTLNRIDDPKSKGWWSGDNHLHMNYAGVYYTSPAELLRQAAAEDLHVLNNLVCNKEQRIPDVGRFTGKIDTASTADRVLFHSQEYHPPFWGHAVFLDLKEHLIIPDYVGYSNTVVNSSYPTNTTVFRVAKAQGALTGYAHDTGAHLPVDIALGTVDFLEANWPETMETLYHAWNCGYGLVASAGVDTFSDFYRSNVLGTNRVYVRSGATLDYGRWMEDFRRGRSFVTTGPLIYLKVNGKEPGDRIELPEGRHTVTAEVSVKSISPVETLELVHNGKVIESSTGGELRKTVTVEGSGWVAARVRARPIRNIRKPVPWAATMPVWIGVGKRPVRARADAQFFIDWLDRTLSQVTGAAMSAEERAKRAAAEKTLGVPPASAIAWNNDAEKEEVRVLYQEARALLLKRRDEAGN